MAEKRSTVLDDIIDNFDKIVEQIDLLLEDKKEEYKDGDNVESREDMEHCL